MPALGVHFALTDEDLAALKAIPDEQDRLEFLQEDIEERYLKAKHDGFAAETDKAWDAIHRALTDGELSWDGGDYPLNHAVLAGELLYSDDDYIMSLKTPAQVKDVAAALSAIGEPELRRRYFAMDPESYGMPLSEEDFTYIWDWFQNMRQLFANAARANRHVLFTADQ